MTRWQLKWQPLDRAAPWALMLLILILCWKLAALFWWVVAPPQALQMQQVHLGSQQPRIPNITAFSLFAAPANNMVDASSNLLLQGVVVAMPSRDSSAVIKVNDVAERYRVGEMVANTGYQLSEVYWDKVVLQQGTATKELQFKGIDKGLYQPVMLATANNPNNSTSPMGGSTEVYTPTQNNNPTAAIGQAIQQIQDNRQQYLQNMGVNAGGGQGYEVTERTPAALRNKLGLRAGDRIISLNGQVVGSGQNDTQLLEQARREGRVTIEIKRGDQTMTIQQEF